jgi:hypothetical protein
MIAVHYHDELSISIININILNKTVSGDLMGNEIKKLHILGLNDARHADDPATDKFFAVVMQYDGFGSNYDVVIFIKPAVLYEFVVQRNIRTEMKRNEQTYLLKTLERLNSSHRDEIMAKVKFI